MSNPEILSRESSELRELDWVKNQIKAELANLQAETFYNKNEQTGKIDFQLSTVKSYLENLKGQDRKSLSSKNSSALVMAVQIALESQEYDVGKIDGLLGRKTMEQVKEFQENNNLNADGIPGPETIAKILEKLGSVSVPPEGGSNPPEGGSNPPEGGSNPPEGGSNPPEGGSNPPEGVKNSPDKPKEAPELPPLHKLRTKDVGSWRGDTFVIKAGLEQQDAKGTYINVAGKKYYKDVTDGSGYKVDKLSDWYWYIYIGGYKNGKRNGQGRARASDGRCYQGEYKAGKVTKGRWRSANGDTEVGTFDQDENLWDGVKTEKGKKIVYKNGKPLNQ